MAITHVDGNIEAQLQSIYQNPFLFKIGFFFAALIAPSIISLFAILTLFYKTQKSTPILNIIGMFFLVPYIVCVTISYTSQFTLVTNSLLNDNTIQVINWYFGSFNSVTYFLNQLGYTFFALGGFCLGYRFLFEKDITKLFGILLELSSILSIIAFAGLAVNSKIINNATILGGLCTLPFGIISIIVGLKLKKITE